MFGISCALAVLILCSSSSAIILHLNASEYHRMPALYELDEYDSCMEQDQGLFCVVKADLHAEPGNQLMHMIEEYSKDYNRHYNHSIIDRGICVRSSCSRFVIGRDLEDEAQLDEVLQQCINDTIYRQYGLEAKLSMRLYCNRPGEKDDINIADWGFLAVIAFLVLGVLVGTKYDQYLKRQGKTEGNPYLLSFSAVRNFNWLLQTDVEEERLKNLRGFHGIRSITNFLMISMHVAFIYASGYHKSTLDIERAYNYSLPYIFYNGLVIVQIFFYMSGFLLAYNMEIYSETKQLTWGTIPFAMFKRLMRLVPGLSIMIWFTSTWLRHLGSGPLWKLQITNSVMADCRKYWWSHVLLVNNYVPENRSCAIQTWHIAADTQLFLLGMVVMVAAKDSTRRFAMMGLLLLGTITPTVHAWLKGYDGLVLMRPEFYRTLLNSTFFEFHIAGHNNVQNFAVGIAVARLVYKYQLKGKDFSHCKLYRRTHLLVIPAIAYYFYMAYIFYDTDVSLAWRAIYAGAQRFFIAVLTSFLVLAFVMKVPSVLTKVLESRVFVVTSRLTYSVYLVHMNLVHYELATRKHPADINAFKLLIIYLGVIFLAYMIAFCFYIVVEAPFSGITKAITSPKKQTVKKTVNEAIADKEKTVNGTKALNGSSANGIANKSREKKEL